jgi:hypothetical protein
MTSGDRITADKIRTAMRMLFKQPEWSLMFEVANATGGAANRYADAVAMSLWPSRGLELHGFEIKVSRSDWRNEAKKPEKAEAIAKYCDRWFVVAPPGVVPLEELPPAWGLKTYDGKWKTEREAQKTDAATISRPFLAALLRRGGGGLSEGEIAVLLEQRDQQREKLFQERVDREVERRLREFKELKAVVAEFEAASGVQISKQWDAEKIGAAVKIVKLIGPANVYHGAAHMAAAHERAAAQLRQAVEELGI